MRYYSDNIIMIIGTWRHRLWLISATGACIDWESSVASNTLKTRDLFLKCVSPPENWFHMHGAAKAICAAILFL